MLSELSQYLIQRICSKNCWVISSYQDIKKPLLSKALFEYLPRDSKLYKSAVGTRYLSSTWNLAAQPKVKYLINKGT
jgi:hypothetical protein